MSQTMLDLLTSQLEGGGLAAISRQVGIGQDQTRQIASAALPALLSGLARNAQQAAGATALAGALDRDHDGSVLDDIAGFLGQSQRASAGAGILRHVFGGRQSSVESTVGQMTGIDSKKVGQVVAMLAPLVLGMLGKAKRERGLDPGGLADLLGGERRAVQQRVPEAMDLLGGLLDSDGDGQIGDDIAKIGGGLLGSLFGRRK